MTTCQIDWCDIFTYNEETGRLHWRYKFCRSMNAGDVAGDVNAHGYYRVTVNGKQYLSHRIVWDMLYPENKLTKEDEIDHIDHNPLNNLRTNLRKVDRKTNGRNVSKGPLNTSGVVGVYWRKREQKWLAQIKVNQKSLHVGYFDNFDEAVIARKAAEQKHGFHENHGK